jgi:Uma2 family endonuclease
MRGPEGRSLRGEGSGAMAVELIRHRFSAEEYYQMGRAGVLRDDDRVELIQGEIVDMTLIGTRHMAAVNVLNRWLAAGCGARAIVQVQGPIRIGADSEPQPDVTVLRARDDLYRTVRPGAADVLLLIEVSDTSLPYDRGVKLPLYARAGLSEVWIVDLEGAHVEMYREPFPDGYRQVETRGRGARIQPAAFPDLMLAVTDLLG